MLAIAHSFDRSLNDKPSPKILFTINFWGSKIYPMKIFEGGKFSSPFTKRAINLSIDGAIDKLISLFCSDKQICEHSWSISRIDWLRFCLPRVLRLTIASLPRFVLQTNRYRATRKNMSSGFRSKNYWSSCWLINNFSPSRSKNLSIIAFRINFSPSRKQKICFYKSTRVTSIGMNRFAIDSTVLIIKRCRLAIDDCIVTKIFVPKIFIALQENKNYFYKSTIFQIVKELSSLAFAILLQTLSFVRWRRFCGALPTEPRALHWRRASSNSTRGSVRGWQLHSPYARAPASLREPRRATRKIAKFWEISDFRFATLGADSLHESIFHSKNFLQIFSNFVF